jgi:hypothetical protein
MPFSRRLKAIVVRLASWRQDGTDALYVGCGNRFDDDRRLVRVPVALRPGRGPNRSSGTPRQAVRLLHAVVLNGREPPIGSPSAPPCTAPRAVIRHLRRLLRSI